MLLRAVAAASSRRGLARRRTVIMREQSGGARAAQPRPRGRWHNRPMLRLTCSLLAAAVLLPALALAQIDVAGEWNVTFTGPQGPAEYTMYVTQEGTRLTGRMTSPSGEFPLRGAVEESRFRIVWSLPDNGRMLEITFVGTVQGEMLTGTARIANAGEGPVSGERIGR
jgi:hypothetical protein